MELADSQKAACFNGYFPHSDLYFLFDFQQIEEFTIIDYSVTIKDLWPLESLQYLRVLHLEGIQITIEGKAAIPRLVAALSRLETLDLDTCGLDTETYVQLLGICLNSVVMHRFSYLHNEVIAEGIRPFETPLRGALRDLQVTLQCNFSSPAIALKTVIQSVHLLTDFSLDCSCLDHFASCCLVEAFSSLTSLQRLSLKGVLMKKKSWRDVLNGLKQVIYLQDLTVDFTKIGDKELPFLVGSLCHLSWVRRASLRYCRLTEEGKTYISQVVHRVEFLLYVVCMSLERCCHNYGRISFGSFASSGLKADS